MDAPNAAAIRLTTTELLSRLVSFGISYRVSTIPTCDVFIRRMADRLLA